MAGEGSGGSGGRAEIACQQVLQPDGSVFSVQWMVLADREPPGAAFLLERYFSFVARSTFGLIRPTTTPDGVEFRLLGRFSLLTFAPPRYVGGVGTSAVHLEVVGGLLAQPGFARLGVFSLSAESLAEGVRITSELSDFRPRLLGPPPPPWPRRLLYQFTQAFIHKKTTIGYLCAVREELTGEKARPAVRAVRVREGRPV